MVNSLVRSQKAATTRHALESERSGEEAELACTGVVVASVDDERTVCSARAQKIVQVPQERPEFRASLITHGPLQI